MSVFAVVLLIWLLPTFVFLGAASIALPAALAARAAHPVIAGRDNQAAANPGSEGEYVVVAS